MNNHNQLSQKNAGLLEHSGSFFALSGAYSLLIARNSKAASHQISCVLHMPTSSSQPGW